MAKRIGILTAGSDCSGLNAAIRAVGKAARGIYHMEVTGFQDGFEGLIEDRTVPLEGSAFSGILTAGGTILGTSRNTPEADGSQASEDLLDKAAQTYKRHRLDALVCIGGRETPGSALHLAERGLNVIMLPKSIDNDVFGTELTIGFSSAVEVAAESIDRLHSTAHAHHRIIVVELMGRSVGWLALGAGIAGGADIILIPELPYDINAIAAAIDQRNQAGKRFSIIAVSERIISKDEAAFEGRLRQINARLRPEPEREQVDLELDKIQQQRTGTTFQISNQLKAATGLETRITILGYLMRGGAPSAGDRLLATRLGTECVGQIDRGQFGVMLAVRGDVITAVPLQESAGKHKPIPAGHPWIEAARAVGTCLGDC